MICGIFDPQARPSADDALAAMLDATRHRGPDGTDRWVGHGVALGQHRLRITPEDQQACAPWHDADAQVAAVLEGRLDNRETLIRALGIEAAAGRAMADGALVCAAYARWNSAFAEHLQGEYAAAVWDGRARRLVTANSRTGAPPIFYVQHDGVWHFASDMRAIVAIPGRAPQPNLTKIAALAYPAGMLSEPTVTYYEGVRRQPAASVMTFAADREPQARTYWRPEIRDFPYRSDDEWIDAIRTALFDEVRARLRTAHPVAALLSGGLDSSILCAVAATILAEQGRELITLSAVLPDGADPTLRDERAFIDEMDVFPNLKRIYVSDPWRGPFDDLEQILRGGSTPMLTSRHYQYAAFAAAAREHGAKTLFDGVGGEFSVTQYGSGYVWECILALRWGEAARLVRNFAATEKRRLRGIVRGEILDPLAARILHQHNAKRWASALLRREFLDRMPRPAYTLRTTASLRDHRAVLWENTRRMAGITSNDGYWGYEAPRLTTPFTAPALLELCLAAPGRLKSFRGHRRGLARRTMQNLLPPKILWRTDKMPFAPDYQSRYERSRVTAHGILNAMSEDHRVAQIIDLEKVRRRLDQPASALDDMHTVPYTVDIGLFVHAFA
jgi:asparagine synthase (glutamine-hydrolysing)